MVEELDKIWWQQHSFVVLLIFEDTYVSGIKSCLALYIFQNGT